MAVAFCGERGSYGELASLEFFYRRQKGVSVAEFDDVFESVAKGDVEYGIVPIENSLAGSIHKNYDLLLESKLLIKGEILLRVSHCLIANKGVKFKDIKRIYSHPQALAQCKEYLKQFKRSNLISLSNTAAAVKKVKDEKLLDSAAVASMQAAIDFDMQVIAKGIEDNKWNTTRFLILSKNGSVMYRKNIPMKTSIVFATKNIPGALFKCLSVFALRDIDLYKIESRPVHGEGFEYLFYLDFKGYANDEAQRNAINHLQEITTFYRMLGSYPVGQEVAPEYKKRRN